MSVLKQRTLCQMVVTATFMTSRSFTVDIVQFMNATTKNRFLKCSTFLGPLMSLFSILNLNVLFLSYFALMVSLLKL